jgi:hypothetical protein
MNVSIKRNGTKVAIFLNYEETRKLIDDLTNPYSANYSTSVDLGEELKRQLNGDEVYRSAH